jgi:apolipoprotein N-acyltransferase
LRDATTLATRVGAAPEWVAAATLLVLLGEVLVRRRTRRVPSPKDKDDDDQA